MELLWEDLANSHCSQHCGNGEELTGDVYPSRSHMGEIQPQGQKPSHPHPGPPFVWENKAIAKKN